MRQTTAHDFKICTNLQNLRKQFWLDSNSLEKDQKKKKREMRLVEQAAINYELFFWSMHICSNAKWTQIKKQWGRGMAVKHTDERNTTLHNYLYILDKCKHVFFFFLVKHSLQTTVSTISNSWPWILYNESGIVKYYR